MIFYFTGTGNSLSVAKQVQSPGEHLIDMGKARWKPELVYDLAPGEKVGFVFPVYFYGLPDTVRQFVSMVKLSAVPSYIYTIITCGGSIGGAGQMLGDLLQKQGYRLNCVYQVKMPDNYVLLYDAPSEEQAQKVLKDSEQKIRSFPGSIENLHSDGYPANLAARAKTAILYPWYDRTRKTAKFHADGTCTGCGACAARCPAKAIVIEDGKPKWVKERCDHCLACVRCGSVFYGKRPTGIRYIHPDLLKKG